MINKENLELFVSEELKYKESVKVKHWSLINNRLHIVFNSGFGEIVRINRFNEWFEKKRDEKINEILNKSENNIF